MFLEKLQSTVLNPPIFPCLSTPHSSADCHIPSVGSSGFAALVDAATAQVRVFGKLALIPRQKNANILPRVSYQIQCLRHQNLFLPSHFAETGNSSWGLCYAFSSIFSSQFAQESECYPFFLVCGRRSCLAQRPPQSSTRAPNSAN
jgi:hypothetical protein